MKPLLFIGIIVAVLGAFVLVRGATYSRNRTVVSIGDMHVSASERRSIPIWVGVAALAGGLVMIGTSVTRQKA